MRVQPFLREAVEWSSLRGADLAVIHSALSSQSSHAQPGWSWDPRVIIEIVGPVVCRRRTETGRDNLLISRRAHTPCLQRWPTDHGVIPAGGRDGDHRPRRRSLPSRGDARGGGACDSQRRQGLDHVVRMVRCGGRRRAHRNQSGPRRDASSLGVLEGPRSRAASGPGRSARRSKRARARSGRRRREARPRGLEHPSLTRAARPHRSVRVGLQPTDRVAPASGPLRTRHRVQRSQVIALPALLVRGT
jgi:hypothetical protein